MQVGDRVRWVPTGQEGRVMELRDGGLGNWAIYDYADRFELVNECRVKPADVLDRAFDPEIHASSGSGRASGFAESTGGPKR